MNSNKIKDSQADLQPPGITSLDSFTNMASASTIRMASSSKLMLFNTSNVFQCPHSSNTSNFFNDIPNGHLFPGSGLDINSNSFPANSFDNEGNFTGESVLEIKDTESHVSRTASTIEHDDSHTQTDISASKNKIAPHQHLGESCSTPEKHTTGTELSAKAASERCQVSAKHESENQLIPKPPVVMANSTSENYGHQTELTSEKPASDSPSASGKPEQTKLASKPPISKINPALKPPVSKNNLASKTPLDSDSNAVLLQTILKQRSASFDSTLETLPSMLMTGAQLPNENISQHSVVSQCMAPPGPSPVDENQELEKDLDQEEADRAGKLRTMRRQFAQSRRFSAYDDIWMKNVAAYTQSYLTIPDPNNQKLNWTKPPLTVLIIRKHLDDTVLIPFRDLVVWLVKEKNMVLYVEQAVMEEDILAADEGFQKVQDKLKAFKEDDDLTDKIDFIICLGGDGTLLYASSLFQGSVPPVMAFNMGSLGFLTPFQFYQDFKQEVSRVMKGSASLLLRYRLKCAVVTHDIDKEADIPHVKNIQKEHRSLKTHKLVLNEVVVDRGSSSYLSNLDLYIEGRRVTSVQGDGLIISTPTGSTAYAVAAGASMIHPSVPCILLTPICPHSLSFRPVVVPAGVEIKIMLSAGARGTAMVSFDGRDRMEIHQGDSLRITTASYPVPSVCAADQIEDWFDGLAVCLNWNLRQQQRPLQSTNSLTSIDSIDLIQ